MNQIRRLIIRDSHKTTAGKVSVPVLPQFLLQIFLKSIKGIYFQTEGPAPAPDSKFRDISAMTVKPEKNIIARIMSGTSIASRSDNLSSQCATVLSGTDLRDDRS